MTVVDRMITLLQEVRQHGRNPLQIVLTEETWQRMTREVSDAAGVEPGMQREPTTFGGCAIGKGPGRDRIILAYVKGGEDHVLI